MLLSSSSHLVFYRAGNVRGLVQINVMCKQKIVKDSVTSLMQSLHEALFTVSGKDARRCLLELLL